MARESKKDKIKAILTSDPDLDITVVAKRAGTDIKYARRIRQEMEGKVGVSHAGNPSTPATPPLQDTGDDVRSTFEFADSPAPVSDDATKEQPNIVKKGWETLQGVLGISPATSKSTVPIALTPRQLQFVHSITPVMSLAFMTIAGVIWYRIGEEYKGLAPSEDVAQKIVEPLVRIYARHATFLTEVSPDVADAGASLVALIGYIYASTKLYQEIKLKKDNENEYGSNNGRSYAQQTGTDGYGGRHVDLQGAGIPNAQQSSANGGYPVPINRGNLTGKEAAQHEALSRLSQLDFASRARRSGRL